MVTPDQVRGLALALPDAIEQDHHGRPSFRVRGRIFATLWSQTELNVMAGDELILAAVADAPAVCSLRYWGRKLSAVQVDLGAADAALVDDLLRSAYSR